MEFKQPAGIKPRQDHLHILTWAKSEHVKRNTKQQHIDTDRDPEFCLFFLVFYKPESFISVIES